MNQPCRPFDSALACDGAQVQLPTLLLERAILTIGYALMYSKLGMPYPVSQAVIMNLASLCVGIALDLRNRQVYLHLCKAGKKDSN